MDGVTALYQHSECKTTRTTENHHHVALWIVFTEQIPNGGLTVVNINE